MSAFKESQNQSQVNNIAVEDTTSNLHIIQTIFDEQIDSRSDFS